MCTCATWSRGAFKHVSWHSLLSNCACRLGLCDLHCRWVDYVVFTFQYFAWHGKVELLLFIWGCWVELCHAFCPLIWGVAMLCVAWTAISWYHWCLQCACICVEAVSLLCCRSGLNLAGRCLCCGLIRAWRMHFASVQSRWFNLFHESSALKCVPCGISVVHSL